MARTTVLLDDHTEGVLDALSEAPFPIGDGVAPRDVDKQELDPPYATLYVLIGGLFDGPISDNQADVLLLYQITATGDTREQAQVVLDICRALMKKDNIVILNRKVRDIRLSTPAAGVMADHDLPNPLFSGVDRYELDTTPI